jgi:twitching motility protein PilT
VSALGRFSDPRILPVLKQVHERETDETVRTRAAEVSHRLAERLGVRSPIEVPDALQRAQHPIDRVLIRAREQGAGDLHFAVGQRPWVRTGASFAPIADAPSFDADTIAAWLLPLLDEAQRRRFDDLGEVDFCHVIPGVGRYRANLFQERNGLAAAFRVIPEQPATCEEIGLPEHLKEILEYHQGLIVISGPAGSGKTTTMGALVNLLNEARPLHIVSVEDPIELVHSSKVALVNQRETGTHTAGFASALRASLREDPDVIVIGEMRDLETIRMALSAAETGHLVIATIQTTGAASTLDRMIDAFPPEEQPQVRTALSETLKYVISQSLVPRLDGVRRAAVFEVLKVTLSVAHLIREAKGIQIPSAMQTGRAAGMVTVDQALHKLVEDKVIAREVALERAEHKEIFETAPVAVTLRGVA